MSRATTMVSGLFQHNIIVTLFHRSLLVVVEEEAVILAIYKSFHSLWFCSEPDTVLSDNSLF